MTLSEFQDAVDRHGSQIAAWPASIRAEALSLAAAEPVARAALAEAGLLAQAIRASDPVTTPSNLAARIFAAAGLEQREERSATSPMVATR